MKEKYLKEVGRLVTEITKEEYEEMKGKYYTDIRVWKQPIQKG